MPVVAHESDAEGGETKLVFGTLNIRHPFTDYTLAQAVALAMNHAKTFLYETPASLEDVRAHIRQMLRSCDHQWLTGYAALDVLDAAIDGVDLTVHSRLL